MLEKNGLTDYFGFDLGDGESAVAWVRADAANEPQMLELFGRKNLLTALGEQCGETLVGEQAFLADPEQLHLCFKSRFLVEPERVGKLIERFAAAVLEELRRIGKLDDPATAAFFIGCPSGWREADRACYLGIFRRAGFENVELVSESRAAFLFARESGELRVPDGDLGKPALIIDAGSSTTDFTFIQSLRTQPALDFGENRLGGGLIDRLLWERNLCRSRHERRLREILKKCPQYAARCELEARKVKEMYFTRLNQQKSAGAGRFLTPCESSVKIYYTSPPITVDIRCEEEDMRAVLNAPLPELQGHSYLESYRSTLLQAKKRMCNALPQMILLTGGASRMEFIGRMAADAFPQAAVLHGSEPEFSIARGLCYALRIDRKTLLFQADVRRLIESSAVEDVLRARMDVLLREIAGVISAEIIERCAPDAFHRWKQGALPTIEALGGEIERQVVQSLESGPARERIEQATRAWLDGLRPELEKLTDPVCVRYGLPLASLRLPSALALDAASLRLETGGMVDLRLMRAVVDVAVASIVAALLGGGGVALLMSGPLGLVISFVIGLAVSRIGTGLAQQHVERANLPAFLRVFFTEGAFERGLNARRAEMEARLLTQLLADTRAGERIVSDVSGAIERQLDQLADEARLMIH